MHIRGGSVLWPLERLREKSSFERQQDAVDELSHLMEDCDNVLSFETLNIAQRYTEARLDICLEIRSWDCGRNFHIVLGRPPRQLGPGDPIGEIGKLSRDVHAGLVIEPAHSFCGFWHIGPDQKSRLSVDDLKPGYVSDIGLGPIAVHIHGEVASSSWAESQQHAAVNSDRVAAGDALQIDRYEPRMMFVRVIESMNRVQQCISLDPVGLENFDHPEGVCRQPFLFAKGNLKFIFRASKGECDPVRGIMAQQSNGAQHLIQRASQVVKDVPNHDVELSGDFGEREAPDFNSIRIDIGGRFIKAGWVGLGERSGLVAGESGRCENIEFGNGLEEVADPRFEIVDFGFGPFALGEATEKWRFRFHDIDSIMAVLNVSAFAHPSMAEELAPQPGAPEKTLRCW